mgnify:CR=1 FL=1
MSDEFEPDPTTPPALETGYEDALAKNAGDHTDDACAALPLGERARALQAGRTTERLTLALTGLREQQSRLAALVALKDAAGGTGMDSDSSAA